eukprot:g41271.t1
MAKSLPLTPNAKQKGRASVAFSESELPPVVDIDDVLSNLYSNQVYDYLRVRSNTQLMAFLSTQSPSETCQFSDNVIKINRRGKKQPRQIVITNKALYNFKERNYKECQRKINISSLRRLVLSLSSDEFVFKVKGEYDYRFIIKHRTEALQLLARFYEQTQAAKIPIRLSEEEDLKMHVVTKQGKKQTELRLSKGEGSKRGTPASQLRSSADRGTAAESESGKKKLDVPRKQINMTPEDWMCKKKGSTKKWDRKYLMLRGGFIEYYTPKIKGNVPLGKGVDVKVDEKVDSVLQSLLSAKGLATGDKLPSKKVLSLLGIKTDFMRFKVEIISKTRKKALMIAAESKETLDAWITAFKNPQKEETQHKEGWLMVKEQNSWLRRYFVLVKKKGEEARCWMYEMVLKDKIDLRGGVSGHSSKVSPTEPKTRHEFASIESHSRFAYRWNISDSSRIFYMAADTPEVMNAWIEAVNAANREYTKPGYESVSEDNPNDLLPEEVREAIEQEAPTGQVTFVFTDVQSSTSLWEKVPDAMDICLEMHDKILRGLLIKFKGYEVKTEGDAFMVAFFTVLDAVLWCLSCQEELVQADWLPEFLKHPAGIREVATDEDGQEVVVWNGMRIRMGIHTGRPNCRRNPVTGRMDYFGPVVNMSARISDAGHGGQVVISHDVLEVVEKEVEEKKNEIFQQMRTEVRDEGFHRLKGIAEELRLYSIHSRLLARRQFPPLRSLSPDEINANEEDDEESDEDMMSEVDDDDDGESHFQSIADQGSSVSLLSQVHEVVSASGTPADLQRVSQGHARAMSSSPVKAKQHQPRELSFDAGDAGVSEDNPL